MVASFSNENPISNINVEIDSEEEDAEDDLFNRAAAVIDEESVLTNQLNTFALDSKSKSKYLG